MLESFRQRNFLLGGIVARFRLGRRDVADRLEEAAVVEPVDLLQGGELYNFQVAPGTASTDHLGLEQAIYRLGQSIDAPILVKSWLHWLGLR